MKPARKQDVVKSRAMQVMVDSVRLPAFQLANNADRNKILDRLMDFAKSPRTSDINIICLLQQGNNSVATLLGADQEQEFKIRFLLIIRKFSLTVLERFEITALVRYLISMCNVHVYDERCLENALIILQSLVKEPLIDIFCEYDFVSQLVDFATQCTGSMQTKALQILQTQCGFSDNARACERVVHEFDRIQLLDQLVGVAKIEVIYIFINLYYCPNPQHSMLFPRVLEMLSQQQENKMFTMPVLLRKAYKDNAERLLSVFDACVKYGWFPCFAKWLGKNDMIALLQDFTVLLPEVLDNDDDQQTRMRALNEAVLGLHREISRKSKSADKFWTVFCLLSWGAKGVYNCDLLHGISEYQDHFLSAVVLMQDILDDIRVREGETEDDEEEDEEELDKTCDLSEPLRAMVFVFKWISTHRNEASVRQVLDYVDQKWKKPCEGGVLGLLVMVQQCASDDSQQLELVNQCIDYLSHNNNQKEDEEDASVGNEAKRLRVEPNQSNSSNMTEENGDEDDNDSTTSFNTQEDPTTLTHVLTTFKQQRIDFDCALEITLHGFIELGIPGVTYFEFQRWLHDTDYDASLLDELDCSQRERSILTMQQIQCATEAEWVGVGISSITWARVRALMRQRQRARFTLALQNV